MDNLSTRRYGFSTPSRQSGTRRGVSTVLRWACTVRNGPEITSLFRLGIADKSGGRRRFIDVIPQVEENFLAVLHEHTAGDPMRREVKWTNLTRREICVRLAEQGTRPMSNEIGQDARPPEERENPFRFVPAPMELPHQPCQHMNREVISGPFLTSGHDRQSRSQSG